MEYDLSLDTVKGSLKIDSMSDEEKTEIIKLKDDIKLDYESVSSYAIGVTKKLTDFSTQILDTVKVKDAPEVENMLLSLVTELNKFNTMELQEEKWGFFKRKKNKAENMLTKYKSISTVISETKNKLEQAEYLN